MPTGAPFPGTCTCGTVKYALLDTPLFVHACHCFWCQRETGSAFVLNGIIEAHRVRLDAGVPIAVDTPSESGEGQQIFRCPVCQVALWGIYGGNWDRFFFVRLGTLEDTHRFSPDIHIFTDSAQPWVHLPDNVPVMSEYYRRSQHWPAESLARREATLAMTDDEARGPI